MARRANKKYNIKSNKVVQQKFSRKEGGEERRRKQREKGEERETDTKTGVGLRVI